MKRRCTYGLLRKAVRLLAAMALGLVCMQCSTQEESVVQPEPQGRELSINLLVSVPAMTRGTRAGSLPFDEERESRVGEASVIFFSQDEEGLSDTVVMWSRGTFLKRDELNPQVYSFKVSFYSNTETDLDTKYNAVVLANAMADASRVLPGMTWREVQEATTRTLVQSEDFTAPLPFDDVSPLPMWGEVKDIRFPGPDESSTPTFSTSLLRSVARVDVSVDEEIGPDKFELVSIAVVNAASSAVLVPDSLSLEPDAEKPGHWHAIRPSLPPSVSYGLRWDHDSVAIGNNISHTLYIPEADIKMGGNYGDGNHHSRAAVVVGARYNHSDSLHWYRIDFRDMEADTLIDVRRNHLYSFRITKVDCEGAESAQAAYDDPAVSVETSLIEWSIPYQSLTYAGTDWISASRESVHLTGNEGSGLIVDVKSTLPLTTLRVRWTGSEEDTYDSGRAVDSVQGIRADVYLEGTRARIVVENMRDNPAGADPRTAVLAMRVAPQLKILLPVVVHPLYDPDWEPEEPMIKDKLR